jgi:non-ribosomal peptide synthetase component F
VLVGITTAGQVAYAQPRLVGHCANVLPLRLRIEGWEAFAECLSNVNRALLDAYEHAEVTFAEILRHVSVPRDPSRLPLLSVRFNLGRGGDTTARLHGLEWEMFTNPRAFENFELFIDAMEVEGSLALECYYNTDLFDSDTIHRRLEEFEVVLQGAVATPEHTVATLQLPDAAGPPNAHRDDPSTVSDTSLRTDARPLPIAPPDEVESVLIEIHKRLLLLPDVSVCDNFFDLGGTSMGAVQLKGEIQRALGVEVPLPLLFGAPTVAELAVAVRTAWQRVDRE